MHMLLTMALMRLTSTEHAAYISVHSTHSSSLVVSIGHWCGTFGLLNSQKHANFFSVFNELLYMHSTLHMHIGQNLTTFYLVVDSTNAKLLN